MASKDKKRSESRVSRPDGLSSVELPTDHKTLCLLLGALTEFIGRCVRKTKSADYAQVKQLFVDFQNQQSCADAQVDDFQAGLVAALPFVDAGTLSSHIIEFDKRLDEWTRRVNREHDRKPLVLGNVEQRKAKRAALETKRKEAADIDARIRRNLVAASEDLTELLITLQQKLVGALTDSGQDASSYFPISELYPREFRTYKKAKKFVDDNGIRTLKPSRQRLMVHVGDWMKAIIKKDDNAFEAIDIDPEILEDATCEIEERKAKAQLKIKSPKT